MDEADETFTLTLSSPTKATLDDATATGTITDDDAAPTVSVSDASASEGDAVEFTLSLSTASGQQVTVQYANLERHSGERDGLYGGVGDADLRGERDVEDGERVDNGMTRWTRRTRRSR